MILTVITPLPIYDYLGWGMDAVIDDVKTCGLLMDEEDKVIICQRIESKDERQICNIIVAIQTYTRATTFTSVGNNYTIHIDFE